MAFALTDSKSALITSFGGALFNFSVATTVKSVRITNTDASNAVTVTLYFDYDGTSANAIDCVLKSFSIGPNQSHVLAGGPWNFGASSRITGVASVSNVVTCHITTATI